MSAQNYSMLLNGVQQDNILVQRTATVTLEVLLYNNPIIKYRSFTDRDRSTTKEIVLDSCGKPTQTTARAMNRGLEQLEWPGRVRVEKGQIWYGDGSGDRFNLDQPFGMSSQAGFLRFYYLPLEPAALEAQEIV